MEIANVKIEQNVKQAAASQDVDVGSFRNRSVVQLTNRNCQNFKAGAGPIKLDIFLALGVVATMAATVAVGVATWSLTKTAATLVIGALVTGILHHTQD